MTIDFPAAFRALTSRESPFRWQRRLFADMERGDIPDACDIPTGLGKTSVMAIWLAALDLHNPNNRLPRRLIYVVDRRTVVDQATDEAEQLAAALGNGTEKGVDPVIATLRHRLTLGTGRSLPISTLRGQLADNRAWLEDPSAPAIVVGTVDMIGSRLLFQGYNVSTRRRPVHAALLGVDALIVLDEAHLVPSFEALVRQIRALTNDDRERAPFSVPALRMMTLSATGRGTADKTFGLLPEDEKDDDIVRKRLNARKRLSLEELPEAADLMEMVAQRAWERGQGGHRVIVFCDSRKAAQAVYDDIEKKLARQLKEQFGKQSPKSTDFIQLMVGARRVREREELTRSKAFKRFSPTMAVGSDAEVAGTAAFLVATSAGEVGVDIDADHMVCDLVAWERMVQRLGRVNRLGNFAEGSLVDVFAVPSDKDKEAETPADSALVETWRAPFDSTLWPVGQDGRRDANPGALRRLRENHEFKNLSDAATTHAPLRPKLTRALIDAWSMTSLDEHAGRPDVAPWIRGWVDEEPQTRVIWRRCLPVRTDDLEPRAKIALGEYVKTAPPHLSETLEIHTDSVVKLLQERAKALLKGQDHEAVEEREADEDVAAQASRLKPRSLVAIVLSPKREVERVLSLGEINASDAKQLRSLVMGRAVILDARIGGLAETGLVDPTESEAPATLDEKPCHEAPDAPGVDVITTKARWLWDDERLQAIRFRVCVARQRTDPAEGWKIVYSRLVESQSEEADDTSEAHEWRVERWIGESTAKKGRDVDQLLSEHQDLASAKATAIADRLLPDHYRMMLSTAAKVHDLGKARENWQRFAGNPGFKREGPNKYPPLAKFTKRGNPTHIRIGAITYRHEFGSLRDVLQDPTIPDIKSIPHEGMRNLALHLIASHHGQVRPVIAPVDELDHPEFSRHLARQAALRFTILQVQWGPWGLAWLEALLRAADGAASREVDESGEES